MRAAKTALVLLILVFAFTFASAADYDCIFENRGQVNCNAVNAGDTYCYYAGPGPVANNPAKAVECTNNSPSGAGTVRCRVSGYGGSASALRCSNTPYYVSGPTMVSGQPASCSYNDCALNQIACASAYAYMQCVPDSQSPGCNKWETQNCVGNDRCYSNTPAELARCVGAEENEITQSGGVYYRVRQQAGSQGQSAGQGTQAGNGTSQPQLQTVVYAFSFAGNALINVTDEGSSPPGEYGVTVKDNAIESIVDYHLDNPNYSVTVTAAASDAIRSASDPAGEAKAQLKSGGITVIAHGFFEQIQLFFFNLWLSLFG